MTQLTGTEGTGLCFEITLARISEEDPKYVIYTVQVRYVSGRDDGKPISIDRRYTQFKSLYDNLKEQQPQLMANITFPPKRLFGNFDANLIAERSAEFQLLLTHISSESRLRSSPATMMFLQEQELSLAKEFLLNKNFIMAQPLLEQSFLLLNKVMTDRSAPVLLALCRLLGCCMHISGMPEACKWGDLALRRYEGVCDSDLLELYIPLIYSCMKVWKQYGKDLSKLEDQLVVIKQKGISIDDQREVLEVVDSVENKLYYT